MNTLRLVTGIALALCLGWANAANATTLSLQATAGHPIDGSGLSTLRAQDGMVCGAVEGPPVAWVISPQLSATGVNYSGAQTTLREGPFSAQVRSRMISFSANNAVFQFGGFTTNAALGTVFVPTNGTLFIEAEVDDDPDGFSCLQSVRFTY